MVKTNSKQANLDSMKSIVESEDLNIVPVKMGQMVDVSIIKTSKNRILVDVAGLNTGIIPEKEFSSDVLDLKPGDTIPAYVLMVENENGQVVLSLKRASKERYWRILEESFKNKDVIKVRVKQANRGGLIVEFGNIEGFLPVSQLSSTHYPKVGDRKDKILEKLRKLINSSLEVKVITYEPATSKVIFSEKEAGDEVLENKLANFKVGQVIDAFVTGVVDFGIFVDLGEVEGLVHISEISWDKVDNIQKLYKPGDKVQVEIIDISNNRISLSIKRLAPDPWLSKVKKLNISDIISGKVTKITPYGAFVSTSENLNGMFHISEIASLKDENIKNIEDIMKIGETYDFVITNIDKKSHKLNLGWPKK